MRHIFRRTLAVLVSLAIVSVSNAQIQQDDKVAPCSTCAAPCGQTCGCNSGCGNGLGSGIGGGSGYCPSPEPQLEMESPTNLFWHDPCACDDDPCQIPTCFDSTPAALYFSGELVPLLRDQIGSQVLQVDSATGREVLRDSVFDTQFDAGARVTGGLALGDWYRIEGTFLGSYTWDTDGAVNDNTGGLNSPFSNFGDPVDAVFDENTFRVGSTHLGIKKSRT